MHQIWPECPPLAASSHSLNLQLPRRLQLLQRNDARRLAYGDTGADVTRIRHAVRGSLGSHAVAITLVWQGKRAFTSAIDGDGDIVTARWMRRPGFAWLRRWTIIERAAFLARRLCEGRCVGFGWNVLVFVCVGVYVHTWSRLSLQAPRKIES